MNAHISLLILTVVSAIATSALAIIAWTQLGKLDRDMDSRLYADYNKRCQKLMVKIPLDATDGTLGLKELLSRGPSIHEDAIRHIHCYYDLCHEEWLLHELGHVNDKKIWSDWMQGMSTALGKKAFREVWDGYEKDGRGQPFTAFMRDLVERPVRPGD